MDFPWMHWGCAASLLPRLRKGKHQFKSMHQHLRLGALESLCRSPEPKCLDFLFWRRAQRPAQPCSPLHAQHLAEKPVPGSQPRYLLPTFDGKGFPTEILLKENPYALPTVSWDLPGERNTPRSLLHLVRSSMSTSMASCSVCSSSRMSSSCTSSSFKPGAGEKGGEFVMSPGTPAGDPYAILAPRYT